MEVTVTNPRLPRQRHPPARSTVTTLAFAAAILAGGCATLEVPPLPEPIRPPTPPAEVAEAVGPPPEDPGELVITPTPGVPVGPGMAEGAAEDLGLDLSGDPIAISFNGVPLAAFIDELFSERLGLSHHISPTLAEMTDLVTLRVLDPLPPAELFAYARRVLESYGVQIRVEDDGTLTFVDSTDVISGEIPIVKPAAPSRRCPPPTARSSSS